MYNVSKVALAFVGALSIAFLSCGCEGQHTYKGKCYEFITYPDGTQVLRECETEETIAVKTKSWRRVGDGPTPQYEYYYRTELHIENEMVDAWEYETIQQFESILNDILDATGLDYDEEDVDYIAGLVGDNWVDPETDWHIWN